MPGYLNKYWFVVALFCGAVALPVQAAQVDDIRILIDVSGSMRQTDPQNLRQPALRMLAGLIPSGANAGVWTFGRYTNMDVKWGRVDDAWRKLAEQGAQKIHSRGQFTHIEGALRRASLGWNQEDPATRRAMILLTDGKIDIAKDETKNAASRKTLIEQSLPELQRKGVKVHTIALSRNTDESLLKRIAIDTGASFEIAENAGELQRVFLKMLERAVKPDTVPLLDNRFEVDGSISEMTLLVFRSSERETRLIAPDKAEFTRENRPASISWKRDQGYDLITVKKPAVGEWQLDADIDPDNRVIVVTDLKLQVNELPTHIAPDQGLEFHVELHNNDKKIGKRSFLKFVDFKLSHEFNGERQALPLKLKNSLDIEDKGIYLSRLDPPLAEGPHDFEVRADGSTFDRSRRVSVQVQWPVAVEIDPAGDIGVKRLRVVPRSEQIKPQSLAVQAILQDPDGGQTTPHLEVVDQAWKGDLAANRMEGVYQLTLDIEAQDHTGALVKHRLGPYPIDAVVAPIPSPPDAAAPPATTETTTDGSGETDQGADPAAAAPSGPAPSQRGWMQSLLIIGGVNLGFIVIGVGVWFFLRKRNSREEPDLLTEEPQGIELDDE